MDDRRQLHVFIFVDLFLWNIRGEIYDKTHMQKQNRVGLTLDWRCKQHSSFVIYTFTCFTLQISVCLWCSVYDNFCHFRPFYAIMKVRVARLCCNGFNNNQIPVLNAMQLKSVRHITCDPCCTERVRYKQGPCLERWKYFKRNLIHTRQRMHSHECIFRCYFHEIL